MAVYFAIGISAGYFFYEDVAIGIEQVKSAAYRALQKACSCSKRKIKTVPSLESTFATKAIYNPISELVDTCALPEAADQASDQVVDAVGEAVEAESEEGQLDEAGAEAAEAAAEAALEADVLEAIDAAMKTTE